MKKLKVLRDRMIVELSQIYPIQESSNIVDWLFRSVSGRGFKDIVLEPEREIDDELAGLLQKKFEELLRHKPVQYVTGHAFFYGIELGVNPSVLIPRPETEELVRWVADENKESTGLKVLDIGTGSGCIILALGRLLSHPVLTGIDISRRALETASGNAAKAGIGVDFRRIDILNEAEWDQLGAFDLVVSNPPYVREMEKSLMRSNVLDYEPQDALFVPDEDPLLFYRAIADFAKVKLQQGGKVYAEINESLGQGTLDLFHSAGFSEVVLRKDFRQRDRMVRACF